MAKRKTDPEPVGVWIEYCWNCPLCDETNRIDYSPQIKGNLPPCECGCVASCEQITENCRS